MSLHLDCGRANSGAHTDARSLLTASPHPPTLECLYLTNNTIELGSVSRDDSVPRLLGRALSSPNSTLRWISLTSNPRIGTFGFVALLDNLRLSATSAAAPSRFSQLHASVCGLMPDSAQPLASWLANPDCGGTRLQGLSLNGNYLSAPGVALVTKSLDDGRCTGLIHAEMLANDEVEAGDDGQTFDLARLEEAAAPITPATWREPLRDALDRNASLLRATRQEAASLLACARVVLMVAPEVHPDAATIRQQVERFSLSDTSPPADAPFPFLRLPVELQQHILRFVPLAKRDRAFQRGGVPASLLSTSDDDSQTFSALSERQFLRVLDYARSRQTLRREIVIHNNVRREARARGPGKSPTSKRPPAIGPRPRMSSAMYPSARSQCLEHFLATTLCDRWEPTNSITAAVAT